MDRPRNEVSKSFRPRVGGSSVFCPEQGGCLLAGAVGREFCSFVLVEQLKFWNCPERGNLSGPVLGVGHWVCRLAGGRSAARLGRTAIDRGLGIQ